MKNIERNFKLLFNTYHFPGILKFKEKKNHKISINTIANNLLQILKNIGERDFKLIFGTYPKDEPVLFPWIRVPEDRREGKERGGRGRIFSSTRLIDGLNLNFLRTRLFSRNETLYYALRQRTSLEERWEEEGGRKCWEGGGGNGGVD